MSVYVGLNGNVWFMTDSWSTVLCTKGQHHLGTLYLNILTNISTLGIINN